MSVCLLTGIGNPLRFIPNAIQSGIQAIGTNMNIEGAWKQTNSETNITYVAMIDFDAITIWAINDDGEYNVYWAGSFDETGILLDKKNTIVSHNFSSLTKDIKNASHIESKVFTIENGVLQFQADYLGIYEDVCAERVDRDKFGVIKYTGKREAKFNPNTNKTLTISNYLIPYPYYYDSIEETSKQNILSTSSETTTTKLLPNPMVGNSEIDFEEYMANDNYVVLYPSDNSSYAEMFVGNYKNANVSKMDDLRKIADNSEMAYSNDYIMISSLEKEENGIMAIKRIFYFNHPDPKTNNVYNTNGIAYETWFSINGGNEVIDIGMCYSYEDISSYDYISDYNCTLNNIEPIIE